MFAFGGAYSFLPLLERELVEKNQWLSRNEFLDVLGVSQIFPGAISVKYATYTGFKVAGLLGAIFANLGNIAGPATMILIATLLYVRYRTNPTVERVFLMIKLSIFGMIIATAFKVISIEQLMQPKHLPIAILSLLLFLYTKIHPAVIIILSAIIGILWR